MKWGVLILQHPWAHVGTCERWRNCSLLHSVNLILFTLLLVHFILRISPHQSPPSFSPSVTSLTFHSRLKTHLFHKSFPLQSCYSFWTAFMDLEPVLNQLGTGVYIVSVSCARLSWSHSAFESTLNSSIISYRQQGIDDGSSILWTKTWQVAQLWRTILQILATPCEGDFVVCHCHAVLVPSLSSYMLHIWCVLSALRRNDASFASGQHC